MSKQAPHPRSTISATEVAQYTHCPYQWYYQRQYGTAHLRQLKQAHHQAKGYTDTTQSLFHKGQVFHKNYVRRDRWRKQLRVVVALVVLALVLGLLLI